MICAVIDTNVLVSALLSENPESATVQVLRKILKGEIVPLFSRDIMDEYSSVLSRNKFGFDPETVDILMTAISEKGIEIAPEPTGATLPDMFDLPFYEVAVEKRDEGAYLVTGNLKHFPKEPFIVTARQLLEIMDGEL